MSFIYVGTHTTFTIVEHGSEKPHSICILWLFCDSVCLHSEAIEYGDSKYVSYWHLKRDPPRQHSQKYNYKKFFFYCKRL